MELDLIATHFTDISWILVALVFGLAVTFVGLPPMVGYLFAGFLLSGLGMHSGETLKDVADIGIMLLLFSIGLKLNLRDLLRPEIWATSVIHMVLVSVVLGGIVLALSFSSLQAFAGLGLTESVVIAFALSFSSTVFAVKVLDEKAEMASLHGKVAIGILIMQDLFAVIFLAGAAGKIPELWALLLVLLIPLRPLLVRLLEKAGHGELLVLAGMALAFGGAELFELVDVKPDLGALLLGVLLAGTSKANELSRALLGFKELFLVAFFLSIGFNGTPTIATAVIAVILSVLMIGKSMLFFALLNKFKLRARTSFLTSLSLSNYSEFGLIVGAVSYSNGLMSGEWLVIIAEAVAITFTVSAIANNRAHSLFANFEHDLLRFESKQRRPDDMPIDVGDAEVLVFGMGRVGTGVYDHLIERYGDKLLGIDLDQSVVERHQKEGRRAIIGDATDYDFWERLKPDSVKLIMLDMSNLHEAMDIMELVRRSGYKGKIAASVKFSECMQPLYDAGVDVVFNVYAQAGAGFAQHVHDTLPVAVEAPTPATDATPARARD